MILLAVGVSLDTWGIGVSYAVSGIKIPVSSKVVIGCINLCMTLMAVFMGQWLGQWIPVQWINRIAGGTLVILGVRMAWNIKGQEGLGFDKNASRILEWKESTAMGIAISADAGMAVLGLVGQGKMIYLFPVMAAASSLIFLTLGGRIGEKIKKIYPAGGLFLVILGLMRICQ